MLVANPAVQYALFEWATQRATRAKSARAARAALRSGRPSPASAAARLSALEVFALGAAAKVGATAVTYPVLVVKSRLQARTAHTAAEARYGGALDAVRRIAREEGAAGFFAGLGDKALQTVRRWLLMAGWCLGGCMGGCFAALGCARFATPPLCQLLSLNSHPAASMHYLAHKQALNAGLMLALKDRIAAGSAALLGALFPARPPPPSDAGSGAAAATAAALDALARGGAGSGAVAAAAMVVVSAAR